MRQSIILFLAIILTRYIYIIWLKNPGAVQDDFWSSFIVKWISGSCFILNFVIYYTPGHQPMNYYTCSNTDPTPDFNLSGKPHIYLELITIIIFFLVKARIMIYQKSSKAHSIDEGSCQKSIFLANFEDQCITDFTSCVCRYKMLNMCLQN